MAADIELPNSTAQLKVIVGELIAAKESTEKAYKEAMEPVEKIREERHKRQQGEKES